MPTPPISNAVLLEKITNVLDKVEIMADDIKCNAADFSKFTNEYSGAHAQVVARTDDAHRRIDELR